MAPLSKGIPWLPAAGSWFELSGFASLEVWLMRPGLQAEVTTMINAEIATRINVTLEAGGILRN
jgi:hypothetical protein